MFRKSVKIAFIFLILFSKLPKIDYTGKIDPHSLFDRKKNNLYIKRVMNKILI
jgi:hypothetical protein